jgi:hypothetical protein
MTSDRSDDEEKHRKGRKPDERKKSRRRDDSDDSDSDRRNKSRKSRTRRRDESSDSDASRRRHKRRKKKKKKKKHRTRSSSDESSSDGEEQAVDNKRLLEKLAARGETLEEREERRAKRRAARITAKFGYTAEDNPFNDPNLHETFTWSKKTQTDPAATKQDHIFSEIEKVRQRRKDRELQFEEMERIRAEESRMKELENYDEWARKEEEFHLQQQRQRSAIRLVEGREKPIDVLAKNILLFGLSDEETKNRATVKYQERYNALNELETLEAELEEPHVFLKVLKLKELEELLEDIEAFRRLEREASGSQIRDSDNVILKYWDNLVLVTQDEILYLKTGGAEGAHAKVLQDILKLFEGQSPSALTKMKGEVIGKLRGSATGGNVDLDYWRTVLSQLDVHLAKTELSDIHSKMLVRQLERLEKKKDELKTAKASNGEDDTKPEAQETSMVPKNVAPEFGDLEEELGLDSEMTLQTGAYSWQDKYRPRKPRYFNRVKTGYDWNKYNQTHYDHDNPPPKTVQGYKFNIFYPDLIDKHKTPQYSLEAADSDEFCIIRFHAGPPYEDIAFKIINREWNRSRKRGFRSTFERGVLSLYFNFTSHWYRR